MAEHGDGGRRARMRTHGVDAHHSGVLRFPLRGMLPHPSAREPRAGSAGTDLRAGRGVSPALSRPRTSRGSAPAAADAGALYQPRVPSVPVAAHVLSPYPSRRRSRRLALLALVCAQLLVAGGALWALTAPTFQARHVRVVGTSDTAVVRAVEALPLDGCDIFRCNTRALERRVEALPAVAQASVSTAYPDGIVVRVTPRVPEVLWQTDAASYVVASDGVVLGAPAGDPEYRADTLPVARDGDGAAFGGTSPAAGKQIEAALVKMAGQLRSGMTAMLGSGWSLEFTAASGFVAAGTDGAQVRFGTPRDAAQAADDTASVAALLTD
ncbi:MAG: cell division protein FtsQ/DivIB, partial [Ktedonobacterales bacterium]